MPDVRLESVTVSDRRRVRLDDVSMAVRDGLFVGVVGGSGSGKSTLLRVIAGLDRLSMGSVHIGGRDVTTVDPGARDVAMVFQQASLMGQRSVRRNIAFPLEVRRHDNDEIGRRVTAEARALGIEKLLQCDPRELSAGEQQVVQVARALVRVPTVLLLDEPFAALDQPLRRRLRGEIAVLQSGYGTTTVMTTNDPDDLELFGSVAVLDSGRLVQYDDVGSVSREPATLHAAAACGQITMLDMTVVSETTGYWLLREDPAGGELVRLRAWAPALAGFVGRRVIVAARPEHVVVSTGGSVPATVVLAIPVPTGAVRCTVAGSTVMASTHAASTLGPGQSVKLRIDDFWIFDQVTERRIA